MTFEAMRGLTALFAAAALSACGGGGSGSEAAPTPPPPEATSPLLLDASTAPAAAVLAPATGEAMLSIAQFAVDSVRRYARPGVTSPQVESCSNGGLLTVTLLDRDGNGIASAGDRISVTAHDCAVPVVTDIVNGTFDVELTAATSPPASGFKGTIALGSGLTFGAATAGSTTVGLLGSMLFDWSSTDWRTALRLTGAPSDDLRVVATAAGESITESIRMPDLVKTLNYDDARSVVTMAYRYESEALGGSLTISTSEPLLAYLNTYPDAGRIVVSGAAGSKLVLTPNFVTASDQYSAALDSNGDGLSESTGTVAWSNSTTGYLWWDATSALTSSIPQFIPRAFATNDFYASLNFDRSGSGATAYRLQLSRPPAATTPTLYARFWDQGSSASYGGAIVNVDATVERRGALIIARPLQPLQHARNYVLQLSIDGTSWFDAVTLQDTLGNSLTLYYGSNFTTPDGLHAVAVADVGALLGASDSLHLNGAGSLATSRPIVAYHWSQISGTPLRFTAPDASETDLTWGATPPTGVESAVIQLTVTDTSGDSDVTQLTIRSANLAGSGHVLYFRSAAGDYIGGGSIALFGDGSAQFQEAMNSGYLHASVISPGYADWWYLDLASSDGSPLHVGAYENAIRAAFRGSQNGIDFTGDGRGCNQTVGRFDVIEIQTDAAGAITRLAVDFEQHCESSTAPALLGSYRVNSSVPIRR